MTSYPCPTCSNVIFCSKSCQKLSLQTHHRIECTILPALWESGASITCMMALRIITQSHLDFFLQIQPTLEVCISFMPWRFYTIFLICITNFDKHIYWVQSIFTKSIPFLSFIWENLCMLIIFSPYYTWRKLVDFKKRPYIHNHS